jgi:hypothetical protein
MIPGNGSKMGGSDGSDVPWDTFQKDVSMAFNNFQLRLF